MRQLLVLLMVFLCAQLYGQTVVDANVRHASGKGPFPLFVTARGAFTSNFQDMRPVAAMLGDEFERSDGKFRMRGGGFTFGGIICGEHWPRWNILAEVGYTKLGRKLHTADRDSVFKWREEIVSFRLGHRFTPFYPVTIHAHLGIFYHYSRALALEGPGSAAERRLRAEYPFGVSGAEADLRLVLLDGVGSGGGLGVFFEVQGLYGFETRRIGAFDTALGGSSTNENVPIRLVCYGFGITVPLALRLR